MGRFELMTSLRATLVKIGRRLLLQEKDGLRKSLHGRDFVLQAQGVTFHNVELDVIGDDNQISLGRGGVYSNVRFRLRGSGHRISFGENCRISRGGVVWVEDERCSLQVGANTSMVEVHIALTEPGSRVTIGEDCMFANDIDLRTGDSHSVIDQRSGERLNFPGDIHIGRHVWVAPHTVILKGVNIGENSIVATGSVVTRSCDPGVIIAGNPAKTIKEGVSWVRERLAKID
jgi:acetyltransferase-like isoleucine patch superfamily enzyme